MYVIKRNGQPEKMHFDKITTRLESLMRNLDPEHVSPELITQKIASQIKPGITTTKIDELAAETAGNMVVRHSDYAILAARILVSNLHKETPDRFSDAMEILHYDGVEKKIAAESLTPEERKKLDESPNTFFDADFMAKVREHRDLLDAAIDLNEDFEFDYFGMRTLLRSYLLQDTRGNIVERPQYMYMRQALKMHLNDISEAIETYRLLSQRKYSHATPTMFNAAIKKGNLSSCFLLVMKDDSIDGIYETLHQVAKISKSSGGIGVAVSNIRAEGSVIKQSRGRSNGLVPMLKVFEYTARYVDQGGGKRKGGVSIYLEPWHYDSWKKFTELRRNNGAEAMRTRDLFPGCWVNDLFMRRVKEGKQWTLFCPRTAPGLHLVWGREFEELYELYEREGRGVCTIAARQLWDDLMNSIADTGLPYMVHKDHSNAKSNQKNLGTIRCSNLCAEIIEFTSPEEVAVCNLASVNLSAFAKKDADGKPFYDFAELHKVVKIAIKNLNSIIDVTYYPVPEAKVSNLRHRPVGLGVVDLAGAMIKMRVPYASPGGKQLNKDIFETMYHAAVESSVEEARKYGAYSTFAGSPMSQGIFQFDMWNVKPSNRYDWETLRAEVKKGIRNSLLIALMPTATTAQIIGGNECFEPISSNLFVRRTLAGEVPLLQKYLVQDLQELGLWTNEIKRKLVAGRGSVQDILEIPAHIRELYKTVWEIPMKDQIDMSADRGAFVCQSQSFNVHLPVATPQILTKMQFYAWEKGLKTASYYTRTKPSSDPIQFTVDNQIVVNRAPTSSSSSSSSSSSAAPSVTAMPKPTAITQLQQQQEEEEAQVCTRESGCTSCQC